MTTKEDLSIYLEKIEHHETPFLSSIQDVEYDTWDYPAGTRDRRAVEIRLQNPGMSRDDAIAQEHNEVRQASAQAAAEFANHVRQNR